MFSSNPQPLHLRLNHQYILTVFVVDVSPPSTFAMFNATKHGAEMIVRVLNSSPHSAYEFELEIDVTNIVHHFESYSIDVEAGTDCDSANESLNSSSNDSSDDDFDVEELELKVIMLVANKSQVHKWATDYSPTALEIYKDFVVIAENCEKNKRKQAVVKRFKGSSSNTTTVLESKDNFSSSSSTTIVLEPDPSLRPMSFSEANTRILERMKKTLATPTRRISFVGDSTGMSQPTNMSYQQPNKAAIAGNKLRVTKREDEDNEG
ncbi:hypothetical protein RND71_038204 [Anisodus tanguticus]|uniref:Uncharacterized protein n=1 Tax=Anisodus tanguticus TaxID=243964 RepID=A0AAE1QZI3_9SOLA|nr:hypothetical protein RND71_038204 [Anisodus tanguticus]